MKKFLFSMMFLIAALFAFGTSKTYAAAVYDHEVTFNMNGGTYVHSDILDLGSKLDNADEPINILVVGDSTGDELDEWVYLLGEKLGGEYQDFSVEHRIYDNTSNYFENATNIQYGNNGDAYVEFDGVVGDEIYTYNSTELSITGDIEITAKVQAEANGGGAILGKFGYPSSKSYALVYATNGTAELGTLTLYWSEDGSTSISEASGTFALPEDGIVWVSATLDIDDGVAGYEIDFKYSLDGVSYTTYDTVTTVAGATSIYESTSNLIIGGLGDFETYAFDGNIYEVEVRDGIDGEIVTSLNFDQANKDSNNSFEDVEGNTWVFDGNLSSILGAPGMLLLNASVSGATIGTFTSNDLEAITNMDLDFVFINYGHNENLVDDYVSDLEDFIETINIHSNNSKVMLLTQNPQTTPRTDAQILAQSIRMDQVKLVASKYDIAICDIFSVLEKDTTAYVSADGIHPTDPGQVVWADKVYDLLNTRTGEGKTEITLLVEDGDVINEPNSPTKDSALFLGWYTDTNLTDEWDFDTDLVQEDLVLYAKWSDNTSIIGGSIISNDTGSLEILGINWIWYALAIGGLGYYFLGTKKGRKAIGKK